MNCFTDEEYVPSAASAPVGILAAAFRAVMWHFAFPALWQSNSEAVHDSVLPHLWHISGPRGLRALMYRLPAERARYIQILWEAYQFLRILLSALKTLMPLITHMHAWADACNLCHAQPPAHLSLHLDIVRDAIRPR